MMARYLDNYKTPAEPHRKPVLLLLMMVAVLLMFQPGTYNVYSCLRLTHTVYTCRRIPVGAMVQLDRIAEKNDITWTVGLNHTNPTVRRSSAYILFILVDKVVSPSHYFLQETCVLLHRFMWF